MEGAYSTYFDNFFLALRMGRTDYKAQGLHTLRAGRAANLGPDFDRLLDQLEAVLNEFDENLTDRNEPTAADTSAYHSARKAWLSFVDDTMKDYVTPKLRKLPAYASFKKFTKSKLAGLPQPELLTQSKALLELYAGHQAALYPALAADSKAKFQAVADADQTRDEADINTGTLILHLEDDRRGIAQAQRRIKAWLELKYDDPAKVYSFFDFSAAKVAKSKKPKV